MLTLELNSHVAVVKGDCRHAAALKDSGRVVVEVELVWRNHFMEGAFSAGGQTFEVARAAPDALPVNVVCHSKTVMRATTSPGNHYAIEYGARRLQIRLDSMLTTRWAVIENGKMLGRVSRAASVKKLAKSDLPADMDLPLLMFILWLTVGRWQHMEASSSGTT